jgi:hypothetical protein
MEKGIRPKACGRKNKPELLYIEYTIKAEFSISEIRMYILHISV